MNFERQPMEEGPRLDKMNLIRDEIRSALILKKCNMDGQAFDECFKSWAGENNDEYERLFEEFITEDETFLERWDNEEEQGGIINRFEDRIKSTTFKRAA